MKRLALVILLILVGVLVAACGSSEPEGPQAVTLDFAGDDSFHYEPAAATAPTGSEITVNFKNNGTLEHNWLLIGSGTNPEAASPADALGGATTGLVAGGATGTVTFSAPPPGTYKFVCTVPGHATGGMIGELTIN